MVGTVDGPRKRFACPLAATPVAPPALKPEPAKRPSRRR
jgi:hypothetical protein